MESMVASMHSFLKSIGFSKIKNRMELDILLKDMQQNSSMSYVTWTDDIMTYVEYTKEFANGIGISIVGEKNKDGDFIFDHYFPYIKGSVISTREEIYINKRVDTDAFTGMCDDYRFGVSLIFYIQNMIEFVEYTRKDCFPRIAAVRLAALSLEGKILLPTEKPDEQIDSKNRIGKQRSLLISEAKKGNQEAIESLTIEDIDKYALVSKRIKNEDIYSIVESSFIPYGSESDIYLILATIEDFHVEINSETKEELVILHLNCNDMFFDVCINQNNLIGEPLTGRRFRGVVWMQGCIDFNE